MTAAMFRRALFSCTFICTAALVLVLVYCLSSSAAAFVTPPPRSLQPLTTKKCDVDTATTPPAAASNHHRRVIPSDERQQRRSPLLSPSTAPLSLSIVPLPQLTIKKFLYGYALYSIAVDIYGRWMEHRMKTCPDDAGGGGVNIAVPTVDELRATVSKVSGLAERPSDRVAWNRWTSSSTVSDDGGGASPTLPRPGEYRFMYREYVNYEERWAICKALKSVHWFLFRQTGRGTMCIEPSGKDVTMKEGFRLLTVIPTEVTWTGKIRDISSSYESKPRNCIVWDRTEMRIGFPFFRTVHSPPLAEKLRKQPWRIVKVSSGSDGKALLGFKRGSIGCLAYDEV